MIEPSAEAASVPSTAPLTEFVINAPTVTKKTRIASCAFSVCANGSMRRVPCIAAQATARGVSSSGEIAQNVEGVANASQQTASGATATQLAAEELAGLADELRDIMARTGGR